LWLCQKLSGVSRKHQPARIIPARRVMLHCICSSDVGRAFRAHEARPAWYRWLVHSRPLWLPGAGLHGVRASSDGITSVGGVMQQAVGDTSGGFSCESKSFL
jgi:hypothetical protein